MQDHYSIGDFIRSMATRGSLGGVARATADAATVLDASGRDLVMIETVGVGRTKSIFRLADVTIGFLCPAWADDVQTIKAGIMEIADIFVINKSDREGAERVEREIAPCNRWPCAATGGLRRCEDGRERGCGNQRTGGSGLRNMRRFWKKENLAQKETSRTGSCGWSRCWRDAMLEKARKQIDGAQPGALMRPKFAEHKPIRIRWWRRLCGPERT